MSQILSFLRVSMQFWREFSHSDGSQAFFKVAVDFLKAPFDALKGI